MMDSSLFESFDDLKEVLVFYSTLIGNTHIDEQIKLFKLLKEAVERIDPEFSFERDEPPTAYEIFLIVEKLSTSISLETFESPDGYYDDSMEFSLWDPMNPIDDTEQYPDTKCVFMENRIS